MFLLSNRNITAGLYCRELMGIANVMFASNLSWNNGLLFEPFVLCFRLTLDMYKLLPTSAMLKGKAPFAILCEDVLWSGAPQMHLCGTFWHRLASGYRGQTYPPSLSPHKNCVLDQTL